MNIFLICAIITTVQSPPQMIGLSDTTPVIREEIAPPVVPPSYKLMPPAGATTFGQRHPGWTYVGKKLAKYGVVGTLLFMYVVKR